MVSDDFGPNGAKGRAVFNPAIAVSLVVTLYRVSQEWPQGWPHESLPSNAKFDIPLPIICTLSYSELCLQDAHQTEFDEKEYKYQIQNVGHFCCHPSFGCGQLATAMPGEFVL